MTWDLAKNSENLVGKYHCMLIGRLAFFLVVLLAGAPGLSNAGVLGSITLKEGSIIHGDVIEMVKGILKVEAAFGAGDPFLIKWEDVANLATSQPMVFVLVDGTSIRGIAEKGNPWELRISVEPLTIYIPIKLASIIAINPPPQKPVKYVANVDFGGKFSGGNTTNKQANLLSKFSARSERLRLRLEGHYFYAEDEGSVTDRNAFGTMQVDFFMTKRWYLYLGVLLEQDTFDDLNLRTNGSAGPGYEIIDKGDYTSPYLRDMTLAADVGFGFSNEDKKIAEDDNFMVFRWSVNWNWPIRPDLSFFHRHQVFPKVESISDYYINTIQGIRINIWEGLNIAIQVNYKYDNTPSPGTGASDTKGLVTIGYAFEN